MESVYSARSNPTRTTTCSIVLHSSQLWIINDCYIPMGRYTYLCNWSCTWNKRDNGIAATFLYPELQSHNSTLRTGLWSIWSQWTCLLFYVASVFINNKSVAAYTLMSGVAASRLELWMFDLSVI